MGGLYSQFPNEQLHLIGLDPRHEEWPHPQPAEFPYIPTTHHRRQRVTNRPGGYPPPRHHHLYTISTRLSVFVRALCHANYSKSTAISSCLYEENTICYMFVIAMKFPGVLCHNRVLANPCGTIIYFQIEGDVSCITHRARTFTCFKTIRLCHCSDCGIVCIKWHQYRSLPRHMFAGIISVQPKSICFSAAMDGPAAKRTISASVAGDGTWPARSARRRVAPGMAGPKRGETWRWMVREAFTAW